MSRLFLLSLVSLLVLFPSIGRSENPNSALGVLNSLPANYRNGVVWLSADNADPHPSEWYVVARNADRAGLAMNLTISRGRIVSERPAFSPRTFTGQLSVIKLSNLQINSTNLWKTADRFADENGRRIGSLSLQLQQSRNSAPVWSVWMYDTRGSYIGFFSALATTGSITSRR